MQIDWNGQVLDKAATLARIKSSDIRLQPNAVKEMDVRVYGDTAVVIGLSTRKGTMNGKDISGATRWNRCAGGRGPIIPTSFIKPYSSSPSI